MSGRCMSSVVNGRRCGPPGGGTGDAPLRRSVLDFGAVGDGVTDDLAAFDACAAVVAGEGGGEIYVPRSAGGFLLLGTFVVPAGCWLVGEGDPSIIRGRPATSADAAVKFAAGTHGGGLLGIQIIGINGGQIGIGLDLTGVQFATVEGLTVWYYEIGLRFSDATPATYCGYVHVSDFTLNVCTVVGAQALANTNSCSLKQGRIFYTINPAGTAVGLDVDTVDAFSAEDITIEPADRCVRVRGVVRCKLDSLYLEPGGEPGSPAFAWDVDVDADSQLRMMDCFPSANQAVQVQAGLEEAVVWDPPDSIFFGGRRHFAAAPGQNLVENGDFRRANGIVFIPRWYGNGAPTLAENTVDFVTGGRSYDVTQATAANDGVGINFTAPDGVDYITAMVRYKNFDSDGVTIQVNAGAGLATWVDNVPPDGGAEWRIATITAPVASPGACAVDVLADVTSGGGHIRVDAVWAVAGRCAAPTREHGHRIELLESAISSIVDRNAIVATDAFGPVDLSTLTGLATPPRGAIGAILRLRATVNGAGSSGHLLTGVALPRIYLSGGVHDELQPVLDGIQTTRVLFVRQMSISGGLNVIGGVCDPTDYDVDLLGWILPH